MNLFNTPRWKHRKPEVRLEALNKLDGRERTIALHEIASNDADTGLRQTAIKQLLDLDLLGAISGDPDAEASRTASVRLQHLLCGSADEKIDVEHRQRFCRMTKNAALLDAVIFNADDDNLKRHALDAALNLREGNGLLQKVALQSQSAEIRMYAVEKINQGTALQKIIGPLRKKDKAASRSAQSKLDDIQLLAGDQATMKRYQLALCEKVEQLNNGTPNNEAIAAIQNEWDALLRKAPEGADSDCSERFARGVRIAARIINPPSQTDTLPQTAAVEPEEVSGANATPTATPLERPVDSAVLVENKTKQSKALQSARQRCEDALATENAKAPLKRLNNALENLRKAMGAADTLSAEDLSAAHETANNATTALSKLTLARNNALDNAAQKLGELAKHTTEQSAGPARDAHRNLVSALKAARSLGGGADLTHISDKLSEIDADFHKLTDAQHWSTNRVRRELCERAEKVATLQLPPPDLAKQVKEIQAEWKKLDQMEHDHGQNALRGRFTSACRKAWEPCVEYFAKLDEQRKGDLQAVSAFVVQLESLSAETMDIGTLLSKLELGNKVERELRGYPAKLRGQWPNKLRAALKPLEKSRDSTWAANATAKQRLIDEVVSLASSEDIREASDRVKRLQSDWKKIGPTKRKQNQAQWEAFRAAGDTIFAQLKQVNTQRKEAQNQHADNVQQQTDIVHSLLSDGAPANALKRKLTDIQRDTEEQIQEAGRHPAVNAFGEACKQVEQLIADRGRQESIAQLEPLRDAAKAKCNDASDSSAARDAVLLLEIAVGVDSPASDTARRMELQLERLSNRFGRNEAPAQRKLLKMVETWYAEHSAPAEDWAALDQRVQAIANG